MINWFSRSKDSSANILKFENSEGSRLNIIIEIDNHNYVKCNMIFYKHERIADISELNLKETLYFLQKYKDFILNFKTKRGIFYRLKFDLRVVGGLLKQKRFSKLFFWLPIGHALFGFDRLFSIDSSNDSCFAATYFEKFHLINVFSPKLSNQPLLAYLHILNVRYLNNIYNKEISQFSEIIKRLAIYIGLLNTVIYIPLSLHFFDPELLQDPFGINSILFYVSLIEIPLILLLVPTLFNYSLRRFISKYIIKL